MTASDDFGNRMKLFEMAEAGRKLMPLLPIVARLDGRTFSKFTKGMDRPYDVLFSSIMMNVTKYLVEHTNANIGYTQSDEISLVWHTDNFKVQTWFDGRIQKMTSQLAAQASVKMNQLVALHMPDFAYRMPTMDARVWNVPNKIEACNALLWREQDATKNSISMAAQHYFSHKQLLHKNSNDKLDLLHENGINWNDYPSFFKRGVYFGRRVFDTKLTVEELNSFPEKHHVRTNPDVVVSRGAVVNLEMPPFSQVTNKIGVVFDGESPTH